MFQLVNDKMYGQPREVIERTKISRTEFEQVVTQDRMQQVNASNPVIENMNVAPSDFLDVAEVAMDVLRVNERYDNLYFVP